MTSLILAEAPLDDIQTPLFLDAIDCRGHRQTLLPVREINLIACALVILNQIMGLAGIRTLNHTGNALKSDAHSVKSLGQAYIYFRGITISLA